MFERMNDQTKQLIVDTKDCAVQLGHDYMGTEHFLLAGTKSESPIVIAVFEKFGFTFDKVREQLVAIVPETTRVISSKLSFTPRAKRVIENSLREAITLRQHLQAPEHIMLALYPGEQYRRNDEDRAVAYQILVALGVNPEDFRMALLEAIMDAS